MGCRFTDTAFKQLENCTFAVEYRGMIFLYSTNLGDSMTLFSIKWSLFKRLSFNILIIPDKMFIMLAV